MRSLKEIGFRKNWIYETLVETGESRAAPMGVWTDDGVKIRLWAYNKTRTCGNIKSDKKLRIYFPKDALAIAKTWGDKRIGASATTGFLDATVVAEENLGDRTEFVCEITGGKTEGITLFNRADGLLTELLVESTKPGKDNALIEKYAEKIKKVAAESDYAKAAEKIRRKR